MEGKRRPPQNFSLSYPARSPHTLCCWRQFYVQCFNKEILTLAVSLICCSVIQQFRILISFPGAIPICSWGVTNHWAFCIFVLCLVSSFAILKTFFLHCGWKEFGSKLTISGHRWGGDCACTSLQCRKQDLSPGFTLT